MTSPLSVGAEEDGRVGFAEAGPRPSGQAPAGLDASRFDPARGLTREQAESLGYSNCFLHPDGFVLSMDTKCGYRVVRGAPSYIGASMRAQAIETRRAETQSGSVEDESAVPKGCAQGSAS